MRSKIVLLLVVTSFILLLVSTTTAQTEDSETYGGETSDVADVPLVGWYLVPVLGAMRRRRHELNERQYLSELPVIN